MSELTDSIQKLKGSSNLPERRFDAAGRALELLNEAIGEIVQPVGNEIFLMHKQVRLTPVDMNDLDTVFPQILPAPVDGKCIVIHTANLQFKQNTSYFYLVPIYLVCASSAPEVNPLLEFGGQFSYNNNWDPNSGLDSLVKEGPTQLPQFASARGIVLATAGAIQQDGEGDVVFDVWYSLMDKVDLA